MARALKDMPHTRRALDAGEVSTSAVRVLVASRDADPEAFRRCERELVEAARIHQVRELQRVAGYWLQAVEQEHRERDQDTLFGGACMPPPPSSAWYGSTGTWTPRPGRAS